MALTASSDTAKDTSAGTGFPARSLVVTVHFPASPGLWSALAGFTHTARNSSSGGTPPSSFTSELSYSDTLVAERKKSGMCLHHTDTHPNLNLGVCGYAEVDAPLRPVELGPVHDPRAPQLPGMFGDRRTPAFTNAYQRYRWDANRNCLNDYSSQWEATVLGMGVTREETLYTPDSGYDIGGDYEYLVLYAGETDLTLHVGREEEFFGYVIHIDGVCTDPDLLALYRQNHAAGRGSLPALRGHQAFGVAAGTEIQVAVRDTGSFMDPRSRNDWWQGR